MRKMLALVMAGLVIVALSGCTTKSSDEVSAATTSTEAQGDEDETSTTKESTDTTDDDGSSSDDDDDTNGIPSGPLGVADCLRLSTAFIALTIAPAALALGASDEQIAEMQDQLDELEADVPDEIRDDFETVAAAYRAYAEALRDAGGNILDPDVQQQIQDASDELNNDEVEAASERISQYFSEECGR